MEQKRQFEDNPSAAYKHAVRILEKLLETEGLDIVNRVFAEATWQNRRDLFSNGKTGPGDGHVCIHRLMGKKCPDSYEHPCESPNVPGKDHGSEWVKDGQTVSIVFQPYCLEFGTLQDLVEYCNQKGIQAEITAADSWHFPGVTLKVELKRKANQS